jgi:hypothetical protein
MATASCISSAAVIFSLPSASDHTCADLSGLNADLGLCQICAWYVSDS